MEIKNITVAGGGVLGSQIALQSAYKGFSVTMWLRSEGSIERAKPKLERLCTIYKQTLEAMKTDPAAYCRGLADSPDVSAATIDELIGNVDRAFDDITLTTDLQEAFGDTDLVIEAIAEIIDEKDAFYSSIRDILPQQTILCTNSSTLLPSAMMGFTGREDRFLALHFANNIWKNNTAEVMGTPKTSEESYEAVVEFARAIGMIALELKKEQPGYLLNSMLVPFLNSAEALKGSDGYGIADYYTSGDIHLKSAGLKAVLNYLRTHALQTEDRRPDTNNIPTRTMEYVSNPSSAVAAPSSEAVSSSESQAESASSSESSSSESTSEDKKYEARYRVDKNGGGTLSVGNDTGNSSVTYTVTDPDKSITVTAVPAEGHVFVKWSDGLTSKTRTDTDFKQNLDVTAVFGTASVHITSEGKGAVGSSYTFKAALSGKYAKTENLRWYANGQEVTQAAGKSSITVVVDSSMANASYKIYAVVTYNDCKVSSNTLTITIGSGVTSESGSTSSSSSSHAGSSGSTSSSSSSASSGSSSHSTSSSSSASSSTSSGSSKAESESESKAESKAESKTESKAESKAESEAESKAESKSEASASKEAESKAE